MFLHGKYIYIEGGNKPTPRPTPPTPHPYPPTPYAPTTHPCPLLQPLLAQSEEALALQSCSQKLAKSLATLSGLPTPRKLKRDLTTHKRDLPTQINKKRPTNTKRDLLTLKRDLLTHKRDLLAHKRDLLTHRGSRCSVAHNNLLDDLAFLGAVAILN